MIRKILCLLGHHNWEHVFEYRDFKNEQGIISKWIAYCKVCLNCKKLCEYEAIKKKKEKEILDQIQIRQDKAEKIYKERK